MDKEQKIKVMLFLLHKTTGMTEKELEPYLASEEEAKKLEIPDDYNEGIKDGEAKVKNAFIKALKKKGIEFGDFKNPNEVISKILEFKAKNDDGDEEEEPKGDGKKANPDEIAALKKAHEKQIKELQDKFELEKEEIQIANSKSLQKIQRESMLREYLTQEGFNIPKDETQAALKLKFALSDIESKNYVWDESAKTFLLADEDGTPVKEKGKPITLKALAINVFEASHGRTPANAKDGAEIKNPSAGDSTFTFEKYKGDIPKSKDEYIKKLVDPILPNDQKQELKAYWQTIEAEKAA